MSRLSKISITSLLAIVGLFLITSAITKKRTQEEKWLAQKWKMWKVEQDGEEIEPENSRVILELKKDFSYVITTEYEMTHRGTWTLDENILVLNDLVTTKEIKLPVTTLDETHLVIEDYKVEGTTTYLTPVTHKDAIHLSHKEHLIAKKWRVYESTKTRNVGAFYEFHEDKSFVYMPAGMSIPASSGKWELSEDHKTITLTVKKTKEVYELAVEELHRHELVLKNTDTGTTNYLHDEFLTKKDLEEEEEETTEE